MKKFTVMIWCAFFVVGSFALMNKAIGDGQMKLSSPAFQHNQMIPKKYSCHGNDVNPPLVIEGIPPATKSLALIIDDPDAPSGNWVHWVVFNIPVADRISENSVPGIQGLNSFGRNDYGGPCPPSGTHRYIHKIYALDIVLDLKKGATKNVLEKAMVGHILDKAELIGLYKGPSGW